MELTEWYRKIQIVEKFNYAHHHCRGGRSDSGSALPLMIGLLLISLFAYMTVVDVYSLLISKMKLERAGEDLVSQVLSEISYQDYYFGGSSSNNSPSFTATNNRVFIPVTCHEVIEKLSQLADALPRDTRVLSVDCASDQLKLSIKKRVDLPFLPQPLVDLQPEVVAFVSGGLQRVHSN